MDIDINSDVFVSEISPARTIGFMSELKQLQAMGLAKGGNVDNVLVYDDTKCLSVPRLMMNWFDTKYWTFLGIYSSSDRLRDILLR